MSEQTTPYLPGYAQLRATPYEPPEVKWKLVSWAVIVLGLAGSLLLYSIYWISDDTIKTILGLQTRAEFILDAAKFIAIFAAGFWAAAQLILLRQQEVSLASLRKSEAELKQLDIIYKETEFKIKKIELETRQQAVVQVTLKPNFYRLESGFVIFTNVIISNTGNRGARIAWSDGAFFVRQIEFDVNGNETYPKEKETIRYVRQTRNPDANAVSHFIRAGGTENLAFAVRVPEPAFYLLAFFAPVSEDERQVSEASGVKYSTGWAASQYLRVEA